QRPVSLPGTGGCSGPRAGVAPRWAPRAWRGRGREKHPLSSGPGPPYGRAPPERLRSGQQRRLQSRRLARGSLGLRHRRRGSSRAPRERASLSGRGRPGRAGTGGRSPATPGPPPARRDQRSPPGAPPGRSSPVPRERQGWTGSPGTRDVPARTAPGKCGRGGGAGPGRGTEPQPPARAVSPLQPGQPFKFSVLEICERIKEEFQLLQAQYHSLKLECEKLLSEKTEMQRHYVMYYEMSYGLNIEMHKQAEIVKRLSAICAQMIPFLTQEVRRRQGVCIRLFCLLGKGHSLNNGRFGGRKPPCLAGGVGEGLCRAVWSPVLPPGRSRL
uniref:Groucho/TLE N-terminal Q-rich domain-containing protein n=1 Tax=Taeniopygia guttata TaxID=59729 RepID=A0A674GDX7_TAEGU